MGSVNNQTKSTERFFRAVDYLSYLLAATTLVAAIWRMLTGDSIDDAFGWITLGYLGAAAGFLAIPRIREFTVGDVSVKMDSLRHEVEEVRGIALSAESGMQRSADAKSERGASVLEEVPGLAAEVKPGTDEDDPWKGAFGGRPEKDGLRLSATVTAMSEANWFLVTITVGPARRLGKEVRDPVRLYLHPMFPRHKPLCFPDQSCTVTISMRAWGAFTVGCVANAGQTHLELDLAEDPTFPKVFRSR